MKIVSLFTHPHVVPNVQDLCLSSEHKSLMKIFDELQDLSDPPIDSKDPNTIKAQKRSKDIGKIIHATSGVQP